jgi:hypothetical protein
MELQKARIIVPVVEFLILAVLVTAVPAVVALDIEIFLYGSSELSVTELSQEALILLSAAMFGATAWRMPNDRAGLLLVAGLFTCMLIREADMWFDMISKGFWIYPALLVGGSAIFYAARCRAATIDALADYAATRSHVYIMIGLLIVLLFSRVFGTSSFLQEIFAENYHPAYKTIIQEGLELLGYIFVAFGSVRFFVQSRKPSPGGPG